MDARPEHDNAEEELPAESPISTPPDFPVSETDDSSFDVETPEEDTPDWLKDLEGSVSEPTPKADMPEAAMPGVTDMLGKPTQEPEVPDWLSDIEQDEAIPAAPEPTSAATLTDEVPDWLRDIESPASQTATPKVDMPGVTDMLGKPAQEPEIPDWLNNMEQDEAIPAAPEPTSAATPTDEVPDWLQDFDWAATAKSVERPRRNTPDVKRYP